MWTRVRLGSGLLSLVDTAAEGKRTIERANLRRGPLDSDRGISCVNWIGAKRLGQGERLVCIRSEVAQGKE